MTRLACSLRRDVRSIVSRHRTQRGCQPSPRRLSSADWPISGASPAVGPYCAQFLHRLPGRGVDGRDEKGLHPPVPVAGPRLDSVPPLPHRHPQFGDEPPHPPGHTEPLDISSHTQHVNVMSRCLLGEPGLADPSRHGEHPAPSAFQRHPTSRVRPIPRKVSRSREGCRCR